MGKNRSAPSSKPKQKDEAKSVGESIAQVFLRSRWRGTVLAVGASGLLLGGIWSSLPDTAKSAELQFASGYIFGSDAEKGAWTENDVLTYVDSRMFDLVVVMDMTVSMNPPYIELAQEI